MVSHDPLTGNWDDNEWDACDYSFYLKEFSVLDQILITYSLRLFLLVLEVQGKCKKYKVYFGRSKYVFEQCCMKTRLIGNKENNSQGLIFWSSETEYSFDKKKISSNTLHSRWKPDHVLCLDRKTPNPLLKPFIFLSLCFIWHLQEFLWLSNHSSIDPAFLTIIDCLLICFLCYVF